MTERIVIRKCEAMDEFHECVRLQREVWGEADLEVEPVTLFIVASQTGGQVIGAFDGDRMVGFTLALAAVRHGSAYLHSHMTGVLSKYRDRGVGRMLKLFQREEALGRDIRLIEWTFDPLEDRNAHFNLNRLGAICRKYIPNLYGVTTSPLHRGLATDRLLAEWVLDSPRVITAVSQGHVEPVLEAGRVSLPPDLEERKAKEPERLGDVQERLRREFTTWFERGHAAVGVRPEGRGASYILAPWSDF